MKFSWPISPFRSSREPSAAAIAAASKVASIDLILVSILSQLPEAALLRCERVCKSWKDLIRSHPHLQWCLFRAPLNRPKKAILEAEAAGPEWYEEYKDIVPYFHPDRNWHLITNTNIEINVFVFLKFRWMVFDHPSHARLDKLGKINLRLLDKENYGTNNKRQPKEPQPLDDPNFDALAWANQLSCKAMYITRPAISTVYIFDNSDVWARGPKTKLHVPSGITVTDYFNCVYQKMSGRLPPEARDGSVTDESRLPQVWLLAGELESHMTRNTPTSVPLRHLHVINPPPFKNATDAETGSDGHPLEEQQQEEQGKSFAPALFNEAFFVNHNSSIDVNRIWSLGPLYTAGGW